MSIYAIINAIWQFICLILTDALKADRTPPELEANAIAEESREESHGVTPVLITATHVPRFQEDQAILSHEVPPSEEQRVVLKNIIIECSEGVERFGTQPDVLILLLVVHSEYWDTERMEKASLVQWRSTENIELGKLNEDHNLVFIVKAVGVAGIGCIVMRAKELLGSMELEHEMKIDREFLTEGKFLPLRLTFTAGLRTIFKTPDSSSQIPRESLGISKLLNDSGNLFRKQFKKTENEDDITKAIVAYQLAIQCTPPDDVNYEDSITWFNNLGRSLKIRFNCIGDLCDIESAISTWQNALQLTPHGHSNKARQLHYLADSFQIRFERTNNLSDIEKALSNQELAVQLTPDGDRAMSLRLENLGLFLYYRFDYGGSDLSMLDDAISNLQKALQNNPDSETILESLGWCFYGRFLHTGDLSQIETAISHNLHALQVSSDSNPLGKASRLTSLGGSLWKKFERTEDPLDIANAITYQQQALELLPEGHRGIKTLLDSLGTSYCSRFQQTRDISDLRRAIVNQQKAVELTPEDHADLAIHLSNLASSLADLYDETKNVSDIESAISKLQQAIKICPDNNFYLPYHLHNLSAALYSRFDHTGNFSDIQSAILHEERAVEITPDHLPAKAFRLRQLGIYYNERSTSTSTSTMNDEDIKPAILNYRMSATHMAGRPSVRLDAAEAWAMLSQAFDPSQALEAYVVVIGLITEVAGVDLMLHRRQTNLRNHSDTTALAVAFAFEQGLIEIALSWLEQGRCLLWGQLKQLRTPADDLRDLDPTLATRFLQVANDLEQVGSRPAQTHSNPRPIPASEIVMQLKVQSHVELAKEWKGILSEIRLLPGFEDFLQPPKVSSILAGLPHDGPVVIFNVEENRCDALALLSGTKSTLHIPLPNFSQEMAVKLSKDLHLYLNENHIRMRDADRSTIPILKRGHEAGIHKILRVLWTCVIKPILDALGYVSKPINRSRIWWCPTSTLTLLPIHAAGLYGMNPPGPCVSDYFVSSYIPTVSMLLEKTKEAQIVDEHPVRLLLISQPATPGLSRIPGTKQESRDIEKVVRAGDVGSLLLEDSEATLTRVVEAMKTHSWVHFACHAIQDGSEPLQSGAHLYDGRLELHEIIRQKLPDADLAFLSACQTSTGDYTLPDEAVHLVAGMLAAGYRSVVGTMWSIKDEDGPEIATTFYRHLLENASSSESRRQLDSTAAARALDYCTQKIRERLGDTEGSLLTWVPYVHFGI